VTRSRESGHHHQSASIHERCKEECVSPSGAVSPQEVATSPGQHCSQTVGRRTELWSVKHERRGYHAESCGRGRLARAASAADTRNSAPVLHFTVLKFPQAVS